MDLGFLFGFLGTWVVVSWALLSSGDLGYFVDVPSMILVIGGSITILAFSSPMRHVAKIFKVGLSTVFFKQRPIDKLIKDMVSYAEIARRDGILSLENKTKEIDDEFIVRGIQMAVDGTDPELIEQIMEADVENLETRHSLGKFTFDMLGKYAPAMGMIGTLVGLVVMLKNMNDPAMLGPGMAVAILTTLYGAVIANCIALPMADRLAKRSAEEVLYKTVIIKGVMAIQSGDNPRIVEQKLRTFLPPSQRTETEDKDAA